VVVTNFAADVPDRLGFCFEQVHASNPQITYIQFTGFGVDSPNASTPAFDGIIQMISGLPHVTGPDGPPSQDGLFIADHLTGVYGAASTGRSSPGAGSCPSTPPRSACSIGSCTTATSWSPTATATG